MPCTHINDQHCELGIVKTLHLYQCRWATPQQRERACSQPSLDRCPPGTTPTVNTRTAHSDQSTHSLKCWLVLFISPHLWGLCEYVRTHPAGYDHGERLDEALDGHQLVEPEHLTGTHIQTSLWHHTWGRVQKWGHIFLWKIAHLYSLQL